LLGSIGSEYHSSGTNPYYSHERFHEAHDLIIRAWTEPGPFAFDGDHFSLRYVNLWPRPYQSPHPPVWIPSQGSSETVAWAADPNRKYPFLVTFSSADLVARYHNTYRDQARQYGYEAAADQLGWACPIYVRETTMGWARPRSTAVSLTAGPMVRIRHPPAESRANFQPGWAAKRRTSVSNPAASAPVCRRLLR
jgi:alkanesulfonate monooxygenase SsuD/methylene tetrahydromethanopterin reductase-like flavin-dependent oxidoreductase (luciferase family)